MAIRKYLIAIGCRAFPTDSMPLSKFFSFSSVFRLGPSKWVTPSTKKTKAPAKSNCMAIGR